MKRKGARGRCRDGGSRLHRWLCVDGDPPLSCRPADEMVPVRRLAGESRIDIAYRQKQKPAVTHPETSVTQLEKDLADGEIRLDHSLLGRPDHGGVTRVADGDSWLRS